MPGQVAYYDRFAKDHFESILACAEPEFWTTDLNEKGRIYREMKERVEMQQALVKEFFTKEFPVLDIGCGFGRQAAWLAKQGFQVTGLDNSPAFIRLAKEIFSQNGLKGDFIVSSLDDYSPPIKFRQILLLDVIEHVPPTKRRQAVAQIRKLAEGQCRLILSLPHLKDRLRSRINNQVIKRIKGMFGYFREREEHPYSIPSHKKILHFFDKDFSVLKFLSTPDTDYYIFQLRNDNL